MFHEKDMNMPALGYKTIWLLMIQLYIVHTCNGNWNIHPSSISLLVSSLER